MGLLWHFIFQNKRSLLLLLSFYIFTVVKQCNQQYCFFEIIFSLLLSPSIYSIFINVPYGLEKYSLFSKYSVHVPIYSFRKTFSNLYAYQIFCLLHLSFTKRNRFKIAKKISNLIINWFIHFPLYLLCFVFSVNEFSIITYSI